MLLFLSLATLLVAPVVFKLVAREVRAAAVLDGFVVVAIAGLVGLHVLPEAIGRGGWPVAVIAALGLALPAVLERVLDRLQRSVHRGTVVVVALGLAIHAFFDGVALNAHDHGMHGHAHSVGHDHLGLAVVLHRLPAALLIWSVARPISARAAWALLACIGLATLGGFFGVEFLDGHLADGWPMVDGLVAGALLHVAMAAHGHWHPEADGAHDHHGHDHHGHDHHGHDHHGHDHHGHDHHGHDHGHDHHGHDHHGHDHDGHDHHGHDHHGHDHHGHDHHGHDHDGHDHGHDHHEHDHGHHGHDHGLPGHHDHDHDPPTPFPEWAAGGAIGAIGMLAVLGGVNDAFAGNGLSFVETFVTLALESAPALLFAFLAAGLVRGFLNPASTRWLSSGGAPRQAAKGMAFGLPLPVCSCGVLPLYEGLVRTGVPTTAGLAFLIATPELGLDAMLISIPLLGPELTVARLIAAAFVAFVAAIVLGRVIRMRAPIAPPPDTRASIPTRQRLRAGLRFGLVDLVDHTLPWVVLGLAIAAMCEPVLAHAGLRSLPAGLDVLIFALVGAPLYVCATGATPLAAVLIHAGVSPGAALAFLLTGPATNVTTYGVLTRLHGRRGAVLFGIGVLVLAVGAGLAVNAVAPAPILPPLHQAAAAHASPLQLVCLAGLALLLLASLFRQGPRGIISQITDAVHVH